MDMLDVSKLNKEVPIPLYFQLKETILAEIMAGNYQVGDAISQTEKNCWNVSNQQNNSQTGNQWSEHKGWLVRMKSKGTPKLNLKSNREFYINALESFNDQIERSAECRVQSCSILKLLCHQRTSRFTYNLKLERRQFIFTESVVQMANRLLRISLTRLSYLRCAVMEHNLKRSQCPILQWKNQQNL